MIIDYNMSHVWVAPINETAMGKSELATPSSPAEARKMGYFRRLA